MAIKRAEKAFTADTGSPHLMAYLTWSSIIDNV